MSRKTSSKWIDRQIKDPFVKQRNHLSARSRAFFKLVEINDKQRFIKKGYKVIDMGAAPGGWSEAACKIIGPRGHILSIDSSDFKSLRNGTCLKIDCLDACLEDEIKKVFVPGSVDVVMSDMAPNLSGIKAKDEAAWLRLVEVSLSTAELFLQKNGAFLVKFFQFRDTASAYNRIKVGLRLFNDLSQSLHGLNQPNFIYWQRKKVRIKGCWTEKSVNVNK